MKPAVRPKPRPRSQYNPVFGEDDELSQSARRTAAANQRHSWDFSRVADELQSRTAGSDSQAGSRKKQANPGGGSGGASGNTTRTAANGRTSGGDPEPARRTALIPPNQSNTARDTGNIRPYLTRPWNSDQQQPIQNTANHVQPLQPRITTTDTRVANEAQDTSPTQPNELNQSETSLVDLVASHRRSRASLDAEGDSLDEAELTGVAKRKFMVGSYIILFVGIFLAVSGAVLTVLAFHNHFGHISM